MHDELRFVLDENQRPETLAFLQSLGYDVEYVPRIGLSGADDEIIAAYAKQTGRVIITFNFDFADMAQAFPHDVPGIIRLRLEPQTPEVINPRLQQLLAHHPPSRILGHLVTITRAKIRFRKL